MTKALVVGGGISGMATALVLARQGIETRLVERDPQIRALGSGITLIGPAMRALERLDLLDECLLQGHGSNNFEVYNIDGTLVHEIPLPSAAEGEGRLPGMMGMTRPDLHRLLIDRVERTEASVHTGMTVTSIEQHPEHARVSYADGSSESYDLVIGADGLRSTVRRLIFGEVPVEFRGQACYRVALPRHPEVTDEIGYIGCPTAHIGLTPTGPSSMYMYCCVQVADTARPAQEELPGRLRGYLEPFGGVAAWAREQISDPSAINFSLFETILVPAPWYRGRGVLVGDSAHCTTPQLAAGAAMCLEDALALGEALESAASVPEALEAYTKRRYERCRFVVASSVKLSYWQTHPDTPGADQEGLREKAWTLLAEPF